MRQGNSRGWKNSYSRERSTDDASYPGDLQLAGAHWTSTNRSRTQRGSSEPRLRSEQRDDDPLREGEGPEAERGAPGRPVPAAEGRGQQALRGLRG